MLESNQPFVMTLSERRVTITALSGPLPPLLSPRLSVENCVGFFWFTAQFFGVLAKMRVVIESGGVWHIVILQPTGAELITVIISHSISAQKPSNCPPGWTRVWTVGDWGRITVKVGFFIRVGHLLIARLLVRSQISLGKDNSEFHPRECDCVWTLDKKHLSTEKALVWMSDCCALSASGEESVHLHTDHLLTLSLTHLFT